MPSPSAVIQRHNGRAPGHIQQGHFPYIGNPSRVVKTSVSPTQNRNMPWLPASNGAEIAPSSRANVARGDDDRLRASSSDRASRPPSPDSGFPYRVLLATERVCPSVDSD